MIWLAGSFCIAVAAALMAWLMGDEERKPVSHPWLDPPP